MPRISRTKGLIKHARSRVFWFRRVVPEALRGADKIGKREIKFSLGTSDLKRAEALASRHWWEWENKFQILQQGPNDIQRIPTREDIAEMALRWRNLWPRADEIEQQSGIVEREEMGPDGRMVIQTRPFNNEDRLAVQRDRLRKTEVAMSNQDLGYLRNTAVDILAEKKFSSAPEIVDRLIPALAKAERDAAEIAARQARGESALSLLDQGRSSYVDDTLTVTDLLQLYLDDTSPRLQTRNEWQMIFRRFVDVVGDRQIRKISKQEIRQFRQAIEQLPTRPNKTIRDLPVQEMIRQADHHQMQRLSVETVRKHVAAVRAVCEWAVTNDLLEQNPAQKMAPKKESQHDKRSPYSAGDLDKIFDPTIYYHYPKSAADFWIPLVCLYSGARIEEIAQLHCGDVEYEDNVPCISIAPTRSRVREEDVKNVKTPSSIRRIPIHRELIDAGFLRFVEGRSGGRHKRLFPELIRNKIGRLGTNVGKRYSRHMRSAGVTDQRKTFHSLRHTFKDACRRAELTEEVHDRLTGHSSQSVGRYYGQGHDLAVLQRNLNKVTYPGLPTLRWSEWKARRE